MNTQCITHNRLSNKWVVVLFTTVQFNCCKISSVISRTNIIFLLPYQFFTLFELKKSIGNNINKIIIKWTNPRTPPPPHEYQLYGNFHELTVAKECNFRNNKDFLISSKHYLSCICYNFLWLLILNAFQLYTCFAF